MTGYLHAPWPIIETHAVELDEAMIEKITASADLLHSDEPMLTDPQPLGPGVRCGWQPVPCLYFEDHRSIQLQPFDRANHFEYRSYALSCARDIYLRSSGRVPQFEKYQQERLGFGAQNVLTVNMQAHGVRGLAHACFTRSDLLEQLASIARQAGGLNICPYQVCNDVWLLAAELHRRSACPVTVVGPAPRITDKANNKLWFCDMARSVLGRDHLPVTLRAYTLGSAVAELRYLAGRSQRVVLKTTSSAGSQGNLIFDSENVLLQSEVDFESTVDGQLRALGWNEEFPLLTATWEAPVLTSPSAQIWIPSVSTGLPVVEGLFAQSLSGARVGFSGAQPAELTLVLEQQIVQEAVMLAAVLQRLGYFGRVSFDAIVVGDTPDTAELHWIECNARWGGVSIPMTVTNRLASDHGLTAPLMVVLQRSPTVNSVQGFDNYIQSLGTDLLDRSSVADGIVCLTPVGEQDSSVVLLIIASDQDAVERLSKKALGAL